MDLFVVVRQDDRREEVDKLALGIACEMTLKSGILVSVFVADQEFLLRHQGFAILEAIEERESRCERRGVGFLDGPGKPEPP